MAKGATPNKGQTVLGLLRQRRPMRDGILGIGWFWFFFTGVMAAVSAFFGRGLPESGPDVLMLLLAVIAGLAVGYGLVRKFSDGTIEIGLIPVGCLGITIVALDLFLIDYDRIVAPNLGSPTILFSQFYTCRLVFDLILAGTFCGLFVIPLYQFLTDRAEPGELSLVRTACRRVSLVFVTAALFLVGVLVALSGKGFGAGGEFVPASFFGGLAIANMLVTLYILIMTQEFSLRFGLWAMARTIYRLRYEGRRQFPRRGAVLVVANHVSFIDWFILSAACQRPIRFVMDHNIFKIPVLNIIFRITRCIPIAPAKEDAAAKERAFMEISKALKEGEVVGIFPEGMITFDGKLNPFRPGMDQILRSDPVPVVPIAIHGVWGSFFSRFGGRAMAKIPKPSKRLIRVRIGTVVEHGATASDMERLIQSMLDDLARPL